MNHHASHTGAPAFSSSVRSQAACDVLTQRHLLSHVALFQHGLPGVTGPLIFQYLTISSRQQATTLDAASIYNLWAEPSDIRLETRLSQRATSKPKWRERITAEAIAKYDTSSMDVLRFQLEACTYQRKPVQALYRRVHRAWEAAAAIGRVDMLTYLYGSHSAAMVNHTVFARIAAGLAVRHGHVAVLAWLETTFGSCAFTKLCDFNLNSVAFRQHDNVLHWMLQRRLGVAGVGLAFIAIASRNEEMLRSLLAYDPPVLLSISTSTSNSLEERHCVALVKFAWSFRLWDVVMCLIEHSCAFPIELLEEAITRRNVDAIRSMVSKLHRAVLERGGSLATWLVFRRIHKDDVQVLEMLAAATEENRRRKLGMSVLMEPRSNDALRILMRVSSTGDIATVLIQAALAGDHDRVAVMRALLDSPLPPVVVAFVDRVLNGGLGPLASLADTYACNADDAHIVQTILHRIQLASRDDVRDTVLRMLFSYPCRATYRILSADADRADGACCDEAFLQVCLSLQRNMIYDRANDQIMSFFRSRREQASN
jgi:hypothetical protein